MAKLICIGLGGAVGSILRFLVTGWGSRFDTPPILAGTFLVNTAGCFVIGILAGGIGETTWVREEYRLAVMVGLLGGFTTFSTFALEGADLLHYGHRWGLVMHVLGHNVVGLVLVLAGMKVGEGMFAR